MIKSCHRGLRGSALTSVLALLFAFSAAIPSAALDPHKTIAQYAHTVWTTKNGLPEADVMAILQTRDGYVWVGSEEGLARFDGVTFTVFDHRNSPLPNNRIQALLEAPDGSLWIGTENGLARLNDRQFANFSTRDGLPSDNIRGLWSSTDGTVWVTTASGVAEFRNNKFETNTSLRRSDADYPRELLHTSSGEIWIAGKLGITVLNANGNRASRTLLPDKAVDIMLQAADGTVWVGTTAGLYRIRNYKPEPYSLGPQAAHTEITALLEDRDRNLWVGLGDGLLRVNKDGVLRYSVNDGLSGAEIKSLFEDAAGNLWVGVFGGGLELFRDTIFTPYGKPEGLSQNVVWSVTQGRDSSIWIGTQSAGVDRLQDGKIRSYSTSHGFTDNTVGSLFEAHDGTLWLGKDSGVARLVGGKVIAAPSKFPYHDQIHAIYEDASGTVWFGTRTEGLIQLRGGKYTVLSIGNGISTNNVQTIIPSRRGGLWIGTLGGLSYYQNGSFTNYTSRDGLSSDQVISLYEDADGTLWIGSVGLNRLKDGKFTQYTAQDGLFDHNPLAILEDDFGYLWLSTNKGIFRVSKQQLNDFAAARVQRVTPTVFTDQDGMRSAECNGGSAPSGWKDREGNLWFATVAGAVKVDPGALTVGAQPLQLHIEEILADKQTVAPTRELRLAAGVHELELHYVAPYFTGAGRVHYRYRLEGFDKSWVDADTRTVAYYTNLPPGDYSFRVEATALDANHSRTEAAMQFYVTPHFYQTVLFNVAASVVLLAFILLGWLWAHRFMLRRQNELKHLVKIRTRQLEAEKAELLEAKAALAQQATHDSLTGLMNRAAVYQVVEQQMRQTEREKSPFVLMLTDLDHFKDVNDTHGHLVGDEVLREFARRLNYNLRPYDHAGRFGGEEFLILMPGLSEDCGDRVRALHRELCHQPFSCGEINLTVTCSIGVAAYRPEFRDVESLLHAADQALYAAKEGGRNCVVIASKSETAHKSELPSKSETVHSQSTPKHH